MGVRGPTGRRISRACPSCTTSRAAVGSACNPTTGCAPTRRFLIRSSTSNERSRGCTSMHTNTEAIRNRSSSPGDRPEGTSSALAALTMNDARLQPGFEDADTSVVAAMPLYGDYDWLDSARRACQTSPRSVEVLRGQDREVLGGHRACSLGAGFAAASRAGRCAALLRGARGARHDAVGGGRAPLREPRCRRRPIPRLPTPSCRERSTRSTGSSRCGAAR